MTNLPAKSDVVAATLARVAEDLVAASAEAKTAKQQVRIRRAMAGLVFAYWAAKFDHGRALLDPKREKKLMARLQECDDRVSDLLWALDGALRDDWVMGRDPRSTRRYDDLSTLLRDRETLERHASVTKGWRDGREHPLALKYLGEHLS